MSSRFTPTAPLLQILFSPSLVRHTLRVVSYHPRRFSHSPNLRIAAKQSLRPHGNPRPVAVIRHSPCVHNQTVCSRFRGHAIAACRDPRAETVTVAGYGEVARRRLDRSRRLVASGRYFGTGGVIDEIMDKVSAILEPL
jgi:hypothetical protein